MNAQVTVTRRGIVRIEPIRAEDESAGFYSDIVLTDEIKSRIVDAIKTEVEPTFLAYREIRNSPDRDHALSLHTAAYAAANEIGKRFTKELQSR